jgi:hypothetical protein
VKYIMQLGALRKLQSVCHRAQLLGNLERTIVFGTQFAAACHLKRSNGSTKKAKPSPLTKLKFQFMMIVIILHFVVGLRLFQTVTHL